ncbi:MAG: DUF2341 domain-containing protein [Myxococcales bacterium]|nr:DUF2341 domain-containing protein [Myxococcales bacterium]
MSRLGVLALIVGGCGFRVAATDGIDALTDTLTDTSIDTPADSFLPTTEWTRRKTITIDNTKVAAGPHLGFPVLISLPTDPDLAADASADGGDIMFIADDGVTRLPYQRQRFVKSTGELIAWVRVPSLSSTATTTLYLYYGNPAATDQSNAAATWNATYRGVWHLDGDVGGTGGVKDSTSNSNHGTAVGGPLLGGVGKLGQATTFDGVDDRINVPDSTSLDATAAAGTFAMWVKFVDPSAGRVQLVMSSGNAFAGTPNGFSWSVQADGDHYFYPWVGNVNDYNLVTNPFANNTWAFACVTYAFATKEVKLYVNGLPLTYAIVNAPTLWTQIAQPAAWLWGGNPNDPAATFFAGQLDELRVSDAVRTPGWILTEYWNQSAPQTFYALGPAASL